jgi:FKBP-type peptidyl-prolyl cis-trans isomerase
VGVVRYRDLKESSGTPALEGDIVTVQYQLAYTEEDLESGRLIEARDETDPIEIRLTTDHVLGSLVDAIKGMRDGGSIRRVFLESDEAFGARGLDTRVAPNRSVVVQVWLRKVIRA